MTTSDRPAEDADDGQAIRGSGRQAGALAERRAGLESVRTDPRASRGSQRRARVKQALAKVFVGDWHPFLRDPLDLIRLSFPVGAVVFALQGDWDAFVRLLIPGALVLLIRALDLPRMVDLLFCIAMLFQGWGNALHLFSQFWWYDNTVHITLPASLAPILYIGFSRLDVVPDPSKRVRHMSEVVGMGLIAACLGVTAASGYEIYEWAVDHWFGQHLFIGETDTITDLADGFLGSIIGGVFLGVWAVARYTSRRLPTRLERRVLGPSPSERDRQPPS
jgi:hypothetical protein